MIREQDVFGKYPTSREDAMSAAKRDSDNSNTMVVIHLGGDEFVAVNADDCPDDTREVARFENGQLVE